MKLICVKNGMWVGSRMLDDSQHWMIDKQKSTSQRQTGDIKLSLQQEPHTHTHTLSHTYTHIHKSTHKSTTQTQLHTYRQMQVRATYTHTHTHTHGDGDDCRHTSETHRMGIKTHFICSY